VLTPFVVEAAEDTPALAPGGVAGVAQFAEALTPGAACGCCGSIWLASREDITGSGVEAK
jgi:NAD(P)H-dependent flavin oxidoreductase YrpB (nitropropane dioxygenase family)